MTFIQFLCLCALFVYSNIGHAQGVPCLHPLPQVSQAQWADYAKAAQDKGLLWRLEKDGRTSWLLGTIHVNRVDTTVLGPKAMAALRQSDVVAPELNVLDPAVVADLLRALAEPLPALPDDLRLRVNKILQEGCHPQAHNSALISRYLLMPSLVVSGIRAQGFFADLSVDSFVLGSAQALKKEIHALEDVAIQKKTMDAMALGTHFESKLQETLTALETGEIQRLLEKFYQVWLKGDVQALASYADWCGCMNTPEDVRVNRHINDDRNPALADGIARLHASGKSVFAAIGLLHMTGPLAVHELLSQKGFKVSFIVP